VLTGHLVGPLLYGIADDPVACAKVNDFAKSNDKLVLKAGAMPISSWMPPPSGLASLPSRDELLAKLLGTMQAPVATFVRTLNEVPGRFVRTLPRSKTEDRSRTRCRSGPAEDRPDFSGRSVNVRQTFRHTQTA
jgi:ribosomal protein L10